MAVSVTDMELCVTEWVLWFRINFRGFSPRRRAISVAESVSNPGYKPSGGKGWHCNEFGELEQVCLWNDVLSPVLTARRATSRPALFFDGSCFSVMASHSLSPKLIFQSTWLLRPVWLRATRTAAKNWLLTHRIGCQWHVNVLHYCAKGPKVSC